MASHIFRKYAGYNPNEIKCWSPSTSIDTNSFDVENIVFTRGSSKAGTAIPSPLARMELFDTAFHILATDQKNNLNGRTIYHQLVSDCLDVMQMIFNSRNSDIGTDKKIWFKEWKVRENIDKLKSKGENHPNNLLAKSFEQIFFDRGSPRFNGTESIFLIYYENKLVGGTSPLTLFFTSPNWSRYIDDGLIANIPVSADGDTFFDNDYRALHERDKAFVEFLYKLYLQNRNAFNRCEGLRKYINKTIDTYFTDWRHQFNEYQSVINNNETDNFIPQTNLMDVDYDKVLTKVENKNLIVNGIHFYHQQEGREKEKIKNVSDFVIRPSENKYSMQYDTGGNVVKVEPPLVLVDGMNMPGDYMEKNSPWDPNTKIKDFYYRAIPLFERRLPQGLSLTVTYPFVTTEDFLEDFLVKMPFKINNSKFYSGYSGDFEYLLPIKKEYFNFFKLVDLKSNLSIIINEGQVKVTLKFPIRNRKGTPEITLMKIYDKSKGNIIECRAGLGIYPFYQITETDANYQSLNDYTVLLAEREDKLKFQSLEFYSFKDYVADGTHLTNEMSQRATWADINSGDSTATSKYFKIKQAFDYIELTYRDTNESRCGGLIMPNFDNRSYDKNNLIKSYTFALDFGTSNTHIAYKENSEALPKPFDIDESDQQMVLLNAPGTDKDLAVKYSNYGQFPAIDATLRREFLPAIITNKSRSAISFPFKTASCEIAAFGNTEKSKVDLFSHINIGYYIDQEAKKADGAIANSIIYTTNLKWLIENNNDDSNKSRVKFFLKQLLIQIKTKTVLNSGKLSDLKVVWSVPLSMQRGNRTTLNGILKDAFKEVFGSSGAKLLEPIPESVAPYFFLTKSESDIQDTANAINIDIGGGTTDVMMFMESSGNRSDKYLTTSFRFAGSDLWGSGYRNKLKDNGFIKNYLNYQKTNNIVPDEINYFTKVKDDGNLSADDLVSLLFRYDDKFRFSDSITIGNPDLGLILYLHYSAIIYHIIQIIEIKQYPLPRYLSFTGKGSQYIKLICGGDESQLEEFTKLLFEAYTDQESQSSFEIYLSSNPKEITANGAVLYALADVEEQKKYEGKFEFIHAGFNPKLDTNLTSKFSDPDADPIAILDTIAIDSELNIAVLNNLNNYLEKTLNNRKITDFLNGFKVKSAKMALSTLKWNGDIFNGSGLIYDSYKTVLKDLHKQDKDNQLPESLFFYALKDALYRLSKSIVETK